MKNYELYSTPESAFAAHVKMCKDITSKENNTEINCKKCSKSSGTSPCIVNWLYEDCSTKIKFKNKDKYQTLQEAQYYFFNNVLPKSNISFKDWLETDCDISEDDYSYWHDIIIED